MSSTVSPPGRCSRPSRLRPVSIATPDSPGSSQTRRPLHVAVDTRALLGGEATGVGRYIEALLSALDNQVRVSRYQDRALPIAGPQLLQPLRMRLDGVTLVHGPANSLPLVRYGLPGVVTIHDLAIYDHPEWFPRGQWFATRVIVPRSIRRASAIICPSQMTRRSIQRLFGVDPDRCHVIAHGVEPEFAVPVATEVRDAVRHKYGLPARYLLQVGTIQPRKNYATTMRALARIPQSERIPLVAAGGAGWGDADVSETVNRLRLSSWVRFVGYAELHDLPALYQMAEAAVFPSLDEGFGLPVLEAFAAGTPLAASDAGAIPEVAGDAALLSSPLDEETLAQNLRTILGDEPLRLRMIAAGRARAQRYSWSASAAAHLAVYDAVAA